MSRLSVLLARETALAWGRGGGALVSVGFYAGVATLLPLAIGPEAERLAAVASGAAWVALALASLLSLERLFERDYEDGALDLLAIGPAPLEAVCLVKCLAQWIATGLPLAIAAPIGAYALNAPAELLPMIALTALWDMTGMPVVTLPAQWNVGISLIAPRGNEATLTQLGIDLQEKALPPAICDLPASRA